MQSLLAAATLGCALLSGTVPPGTLEDIYGDSGNTFQGALGFWVQEGSEGNPSHPGYGVGVDDMVLEWREVSLNKDSTTCATGSCASLSLAVTSAYAASGVLAVTVLDPTPWDPVNPKNDCNGDGDYLDVADDQDCDNNGIQDVIVLGSSSGAAERFALNRVAPGTAQWRGEIPYSIALDLPGVLYLAATGIEPVTARATVRYEDRNDGTGQKCRNAANPALQGFVEDATDVFLDPAASLLVKSVRLTDNGDNDGFADPNETVSLFVTLRNSSGRNRSGIVVRISSNDPTVDCTLSPVLYFGSLAAGETRESTTAATFRVANVARSTLFDELSATFAVTISGDDFDLTPRPQTVVLDLDLNVGGGSLPGTYTEGFEDAGFGSFTTMSLDVGKASLTLSNGLRCQYHNPDLWGCGSDICVNQYCFLGFPNAADNGYDWHVHGTASPDGGRAYLGTQSLHWGVHPGTPGMDTTRLKQLDAVGTALLSLGWSGASPELSFKHQVGLTDCDYVNCPPPGNVDRGVVQLQLVDSTGNGAGSWRKLTPYENAYDTQAVDIYTNCLFDPTDDGNNEDDFFDPTDPNRRLGPSSTCYPEFTFSRLGAIFFSDLFDPTDIHHASDGPGLQGSFGPGTWVRSTFDLGRWRGRSVRMRFLATSIEVGTAVTMQQALLWNPTEADDGWYIDDVQVNNRLLTPATVTVDTANRTGLPACGPVCSSATASLSASPPATSAPGGLTRLDASGSFVDRCADGLLQFRFWADLNGNGVLGEPGDALLRTWTDDPILLEAPADTTRYGVEVRCSSLPSCAASTTTVVAVTCPTTGMAIVPFSQTLGFSSKTALSWSSAAAVDVVRGDLGALRSSGGQFNGTVEVCLGNDLSASSVSDATAPAPGAGKYYLVRGVGASPYCNGTHSWRTGAPAELPGSGGDRDADLALDPNACP